MQSFDDEEDTGEECRFMPYAETVDTRLQRDPVFQAAAVSVRKFTDKATQRFVQRNNIVSLWNVKDRVIRCVLVNSLRQC